MQPNTKKTLFIGTQHIHTASRRLLCLSTHETAQSIIQIRTKKEFSRLPSLVQSASETPSAIPSDDSVSETGAGFDVKAMTHTAATDTAEMTAAVLRIASLRRDRPDSRTIFTSNV
jgi:hypothetical protein